MPVKRKLRQIQFPKTPSSLITPATKLGVSAANVVATILTPSSHQGIFLSERKKDLESLPDFFATTKPMTINMMKNEMISTQSSVAKCIRCIEFNYLSESKEIVLKINKALNFYIHSLLNNLFV